MAETALVYGRGILAELLRPALPGVTVATRWPPDWEDRLPVAFVQVWAATHPDTRFAHARTQVQIDVVAADDRDAFLVADRAHRALADAARTLTPTRDGVLARIEQVAAHVGVGIAGLPADTGTTRTTFTAFLENPRNA